MAYPRPTLLSLFSGIAGLDMGVARALGGARVLAYVERDPYAASVLLARMEDEALEPAPVWCGGLQDADFSAFAGRVDVLTAGAPCQPYSVAGKQRGDADDRHLWPAVFDVVEAVRPAVVFLENVPALLRWFRPVGERLCGLGYELEACLVRAEEVGAPHRRERLFVLAHRDAAGRRELGERGLREDGDAQHGDDADGRGGETLADPDHAQQRQRDAGRRPAVGADAGGAGAAVEHGDVGDPHGERAQIPPEGRNAAKQKPRSDVPQVWPPGPDDAAAWSRVLAVRPDLAPAQPPVRGVDDELPDQVDGALMYRADRLRCLGNAVVPAQAEYAFRLLWARLRGKRTVGKARNPRQS